MNPENGKALVFIALAVLSLSAPLRGQTAEEPVPPAPMLDSLQLPPVTIRDLEHSLAQHDYVAAEKLLLPEIERDPHSPRTARLLALVGTVYFRNQDYLNAAVAWKKSATITPLDPRLQFLLAMAYVRISHPDWAIPLLQSLAAADPKAALYPYWLGRLDYDAHRYEDAIRHFQHSIELDPSMSRAYDNLGLCYFYENKNDLAIANYQKAIDLDRASGPQSPWPYLNLAIAQQFLNRPADAEHNLREALRLDPALAKAHFQLGTLLDDLQKPEEALTELREAARLDPSYPEPHMAMARLLHRLGREPQAREEIQIYLRLRPHGSS